MTFLFSTFDTLTRDVSRMGALLKFRQLIAEAAEIGLENRLYERSFLRPAEVSRERSTSLALKLTETACALALVRINKWYGTLDSRAQRADTFMTGECTRVPMVIVAAGLRLVTM